MSSPSENPSLSVKENIDYFNNLGRPTANPELKREIKAAHNNGEGETINSYSETDSAASGDEAPKPDDEALPRFTGATWQEDYDKKFRGDNIDQDDVVMTDEIQDPPQQSQDQVATPQKVKQGFSDLFKTLERSRVSRRTPVVADVKQEGPAPHQGSDSNYTLRQDTKAKCTLPKALQLKSAPTNQTVEMVESYHAQKMPGLITAKAELIIKIANHERDQLVQAAAAAENIRTLKRKLESVEADIDTINKSATDIKRAHNASTKRRKVEYKEQLKAVLDEPPSGKRCAQRTTRGPCAATTGLQMINEQYWCNRCRKAAIESMAR